MTNHITLAFVLMAASLLGSAQSRPPKIVVADNPIPCNADLCGMIGVGCCLSKN